MHRLAARSAWGLFAVSITACAPATQAAFIPRLELGLRSSRTTDLTLSRPSRVAEQRWDLTVFANLAWSSRRSAALIPRRMELSPDAWIAPCADQDCFWNDSDVDTAAYATDVTP